MVLSLVGTKVPATELRCVYQLCVFSTVDADQSCAVVANQSVAPGRQEEQSQRITA